jgi:hypothetical protein
MASPQFSAEAFLPPHALAFRTSEDTSKHSECLLMSLDLWKAGLGRILMTPRCVLLCSLTCVADDTQSQCRLLGAEHNVLAHRSGPGRCTGRGVRARSATSATVTGGRVRAQAVSTEPYVADPAHSVETGAWSERERVTFPEAPPEEILVYGAPSSSRPDGADGARRGRVVGKRAVGAHLFGAQPY